LTGLVQRANITLKDKNTDITMSDNE